MSNWQSLWQWISTIAVVGIAALGVVACIGWWLIARHRRRLLGEDGVATPWSLEQLESMRQTGQISDDEFKVLRGQLLAGFMSSGRANKPGKSTSPGKSNDNILGQ